MFTITYEILDDNCNTIGTETSNFADIETFDMLGRVAAVEWAHYNEEGKRTGSGNGRNAEAEMREYNRMVEARRAA